jgi:hypothetical protein
MPGGHVLNVFQCKPQRGILAVNIALARVPALTGVNQGYAAAVLLGKAAEEFKGLRRARCQACPTERARD